MAVRIILFRKIREVLFKCLLPLEESPEEVREPYVDRMKEHYKWMSGWGYIWGMGTADVKFLSKNGLPLFRDQSGEMGRAG